MPDKVEIDPDWLRQRYVREGGTLEDIADEKGCSIATVHNRMEEHEIPREATQDIESHTVECAYCGREKEVQRHQYEKQGRFLCDNSCQGEYLAETGETSGENNGRWKGKVTVECAYCGADLDVYPSRLEQKDNHLCDNDCRVEVNGSPSTFLVKTIPSGRATGRITTTVRGAGYAAGSKNVIQTPASCVVTIGVH